VPARPEEIARFKGFTAVALTALYSSAPVLLDPPCKIDEAVMSTDYLCE